MPSDLTTRQKNAHDKTLNAIEDLKTTVNTHAAQYRGGPMTKADRARLQALRVYVLEVCAEVDAFIGVMTERAPADAAEDRAPGALGMADFDA